MYMCMYVYGTLNKSDGTLGIRARCTAPMVHHAWARGMFWSPLCTPLKREANSGSSSATKAWDESKFGNVHGA